MSRSGYSDDCEDTWGLIRWRGAVASAIRGKRGQALLRELAVALDAMPVKELISEQLISADGAFCTLGVLGAARGLAMTDVDPGDGVAVAELFGIAEALAKEVVFENDRDDGVGPMDETPNERWTRMRKWVGENIATGAAS